MKPVTGALLDPHPDYLLRRRLPDGRLIAVLPLLFGAARMGIGDDTGFADYWDYDDPLWACLAALAWDPDTGREPIGWDVHRLSGRRRPDGDARAEYVWP